MSGNSPSSKFRSDRESRHPAQIFLATPIADDETHDLIIDFSDVTHGFREDQRSEDIYPRPGIPLKTALLQTIEGEKITPCRCPYIRD
jgi:hypothetical protein